MKNINDFLDEIPHNRDFQERLASNLKTLTVEEISDVLWLLGQYLKAYHEWLSQ